MPARPAGLAAAATHDAVVLTWDDPGDASVTHYKVHRRIPAIHASGFFVVIEQDTATAAATYTDTGVAPGTHYVYRVTAVNAHGDSQWSRYSSIVTDPAPDPDSAPDPDPAPNPDPEPAPDGAQDPDPAPDPDASDPDEEPAPDPDASDPDASDPDEEPAPDPDASDPDASDPDEEPASDPDASDPDASDPDASDPDASDPDEEPAPDGAQDPEDPDASDPGGVQDPEDPDGVQDPADPDGADPDEPVPDESDADESDPDGADPDGDGSVPVDAADLAPSNLSARAAAGLVALTWDAPAAGAESVTGYEIQRADGEHGPFVVLVADTGSAARSHFDATAVEPGGLYRYRVAARRGSERSRPSATAWALIPQIEIAEPEPPVALPHRTAEEYASFTPTDVARPRDLWTDGSTLWIADHEDHKLQAFNLETGVRKSDSDLALVRPSGVGQQSLQAVWRGGGWYFLGHSGSHVLRFYNSASATLTSTTSVGIGISPSVLWSDRGRLFAGGTGGFMVMSIDVDIRGIGRRTFVSTDGNVRGIASDDDTLWTLERDPSGYTIRARDFWTLARQPQKDFFPVNQTGRAFSGLLIHDDHMWIVQIEQYAYVHVIHYLHNSSVEGEIRVRGEPVLGGELTLDLSRVTAISDPDGLGGLFEGDPVAGEVKFRWYRKEPLGAETSILADDGGHERTYRPTRHDIGSKILGDNRHGQRNVPDADRLQKYVSVAAGAFHTCGLQNDGVLKCWGNNDFGQTDVPALENGMEYISVSAGPWHTCALAAVDLPKPEVSRDGVLKCWGAREDGQQNQTGFEERRLFLVSAGGYAGLRPPADGSPASLDELGQQESRTCTLDYAGSITCEGPDMGAGTDQTGDAPVVGLDDIGQHGPLELEDDRLYYTAVSAGGGHACAVISDGTLDCWGKSDNGQLGPPVVGSGESDNGRPVADDGFEWVEVAAGGWHTCATMQEIGGTGTRLRCWGNERFFDHGDAEDPEDPYHGGHPAGGDAGVNPHSPVAGYWHSCWFHGPADSLMVSCRGDDEFGAARWNNRTLASFDRASQQVAEDGGEGQDTEPLTARFVVVGLQGHHSGAGELLTLRLEFSEEVAVDAEALRDLALVVAGAAVSTVSRVEGLGDVWEIGLVPASDAAVSVLVSASGDCDAAGAVCTGDGRALADGVAITVPGPPSESPDSAGAAVVPGAPLFYSEEVTDLGIELSWNPDSGSTETGYVLYRRVLPRGELSQYAAVWRSGDVTAFVDAGVEAGLEYLYRVAGVNSAGEGPLSAPVRMVVPAERLEAPPGLAAEYTGDGIELRWGAPTNAATTGYVIYRGEFRGDGSPSDGRVSQHAEIAAGDDPVSYLDTGVDEGAKYRYRVAAVNATGEGVKTTWLDIWATASGTDDTGADETGADETGADETGADETGADETGADETGADETGADETGADSEAEPLTAPGRPQNLEGGASAEGAALTWQAPAGSTVAHYVLYRARLDNGQLQGQGMIRHATVDATGAAMAYTDADAEAAVAYRYRVAAVNSAGEGKKSNWLDIEAAGPQP